MIPDGKASGMSNIKSAIDAKESNKGKGEMKKDSGKQQAEKKFDEEGKEVISKKDLKKLEKKQNKTDAKAGIVHEKPVYTKGDSKKQTVHLPVPACTFASGLTCDLLEAWIANKAWMNGAQASQDDVDALRFVGSTPPNPMAHPNLFGWFCSVSHYVPAIQASWPHGSGLPTDCSNAPQQQSTQKPAAPQQEKKAEKKKEAKPAKEEKKDAAPSIESAWDVFSSCDLRVGKIVECIRHHDSEKLYVEQVDLGEGRLRTIGSGLQKQVPIEQMTEGLCMVFANLKPRKLADLMSEGMVLCSANEDHSACELMRPPAGSVVGERIQLEGNPCGGAALSAEMQKVLAPKKKYMERCLEKLKTNDKCEGSFNGVRLMTSKGPVMCKSLAGLSIS